MISGFQKGSLLKRLSAFILDFVLLITLACGFAFLISAITGYSNKLDTLNEFYTFYETKYGLVISPTTEVYNANIDAYTAMYEEINSDAALLGVYSQIFYLTLVIVSGALLASVLILEFVLPLVFKNGQTIGKKIFSLIVVKTNGVKMTNVQLFIRSILGKYTIELMVPFLMVILIYFGIVGVAGLVVLVGLLIVQIALVLFNSYRSPIHDLMAVTGVADKDTQLVFETEAVLVSYKEQQAKEEAERSKSL